MLMININNCSTQQKVEKVAPPLVKLTVLLITAVWSNLGFVDSCCNKAQFSHRTYDSKDTTQKRNSDVSLTSDFLLCADFETGVSWSG